MKLFNSFQIVVLFACMPYIIQWLQTAPFTGAQLALATAGVSYIVMFFMMIGVLWSSMCEWKW